MLDFDWKYNVCVVVRNKSIVLNYFFFYIFVSFCLLDFNRILYETLAHSQQNWKTANEQSIKTNTLYRFVNESIMAAIQTHCHLFSFAWYYTHNSVYIYKYIRSKSVPLIRLCCLQYNNTLLSSRLTDSHGERETGIRCVVLWRTVDKHIHSYNEFLYICMHVYDSIHRHFIRFMYSVVIAMSKASYN